MRRRKKKRNEKKEEEEEEEDEELKEEEEEEDEEEEEKEEEEEYLLQSGDEVDDWTFSHSRSAIEDEFSLPRTENTRQRSHRRARIAQKQLHPLLSGYGTAISNHLRCHLLFIFF